MLIFILLNSFFVRLNHSHLISHIFFHLSKTNLKILLHFKVFEGLRDDGDGEIDSRSEEFVAVKVRRACLNMNRCFY